MASSLRLTVGRIRGPFRSLRNFTSASESASSFQRVAYVTLFTLTAGVGVVYYFDSRAAIHRYLIAPVIRNLLDPESGHKLAVSALESGFAPRDMFPDDERLKIELWGQTLSNPIGLAAGFDKDGRAVDGLFNLGFGWVEVGSVTPKPQPGNPRPRVFHLPEDSALINRYGFPSQGHVSVLSHLRARLPTFPSTTEDGLASLRQGRLLAINLGKNKESQPESPDDFISGVHAFAPYADVLVINVSSPNTPGLRCVWLQGLQKRDLLVHLLCSVVQARDETSASSMRRPKLVLKISPDLDSDGMDDIADAVGTVKGGIDGVIVSNTTVQRPAHLRGANHAEQGGLSGSPLLPLALNVVRGLRKRLPAEVPIIGCGGISSGADALAFAQAGATCIQLYTAFGYDGAGICRRIKDELTEELTRTDTTWRTIVEQAVRENAAASPQSASVQQLVRQAEEIQVLLNDLEERMRRDALAQA
ncbi:Dihydroorotate dehydrogenase-domain-containing protein [Russula earlei]|uniref:Dihydroorotate dehydrogenase-domain-containing protein n=1 Tax=Russula earlei TaxID=71964 RepID=A0ACC0TWM0_9AGAM|nr:Dihydroorotate dehydrogenase-domain-containing protein [Russula earlei]